MGNKSSKHSDKNSKLYSPNKGIKKTNSPSKVQIPIKKNKSEFEEIQKIYEFKELLETGKHFQTRRVVRIGFSDNNLIVLKSVIKKKMSESESTQLERDIEIISSVNYPTIVKLYEHYEDENYIHLIYEHCDGEILFEEINKKGKLPEIQVIKIIYQLICSIVFLNSKGYSHRDIKLENLIYIESTGQLKIIDFNLSRKFTENMSSIKGNPFTIAPEVLKGKYNQKCDVWSIGVVAYFILTGELPFKGVDEWSIFEKIKNSPAPFPKAIFNKLSKNSIDFISKCLVKNVSKRIAIKEALNHDWFKEINMETHSAEKINGDILKSINDKPVLSRFRKIILELVFMLMNKTKLVGIVETFNAIDTKKMGFISYSEISKAINKNEDQVLTSDLKNSEIDYFEFSLTGINFIADTNFFKSIFFVLDRNSDGYIEESDLLETFGKNKLNNFGENDKGIFIEFESNIKMSLDEFLAIFNRK